eukprot:2796517-Amphidinium_carterae.1
MSMKIRRLLLLVKCAGWQCAYWTTLHLCGLDWVSYLGAAYLVASARLNSRSAVPCGAPVHLLQWV